MRQKLGSKSKIGIYDYNYHLNNVFALMKKELSEKNVQLTKKYDLAMVNASLSKTTRHKNIKMILSLSRLLNKDWIDVTKDDVLKLWVNPSHRIVRGVPYKWGGDTTTNSK